MTHVLADCQEPGSAPEPYTLGNRVWANFTLPLLICCYLLSVWWSSGGEHCWAEVSDDDDSGTRGAARHVGVHASPRQDQPVQVRQLTDQPPRTKRSLVRAQCLSRHLFGGRGWILLSQNLQFSTTHPKRFPNCVPWIFFRTGQRITNIQRKLYFNGQ